MKEVAFGIIVVAVVCVVFVLSQSKLSDVSPQEEMIESITESSEIATESQNPSEISTQPLTPDSIPESSANSPAPTSDSQSSSTLGSDTPAQTFVVCADNVAVYESSGHSIIGRASRGLVGEEVRQVEDKIVLRIKGYHRGAQQLYKDSAFDTPMLELYGLDSQMSLEVAFIRNDLSSEKSCEAQPQESQPSPTRPKRARSYGNI